jgi:branched-chain amino acid transport system permease protein
MLQAIISGITTGCLLGLIATAMTLLYRSSRNFNLVLGDLMVLCIFLAAALAAHLGSLLLLPLMVVAGLVVGGVGGSLLFRRVDAYPFTAQLLYTFGLALVVQGVIRAFWGPDPKALNIAVAPVQSLHLGDSVVHVQTIWLTAMVVVMAAALWGLSRYTLLGKAFLAVSDNVVGARLTGISVSLIKAGVIVVVMGLVALTGLIYGSLTAVYYASGIEFTLKAMIVALLADFSSPSLVLALGLLVGLTESLAAYYISSQFKAVITFSVLLVTLLLRPRGLGG